MKRVSSGRLVAAAALLVTSTAASAMAERPAHDGEWNVTRATLAPGTTPSPTQITLVRGIATRDDIAMQDGTIDVDLDAPSQDQFAGLVFRAANTADYEIVYFSAEKGRWRDVQYQPFFDGSPSWQLYNGPGYRADLSPAIVPADRPLHVRIVIAGTRADVYLNGGATPVMRIPELKRLPASGRVGVWAGGSAASRMTVANYAVVTHVEKPPAAIPAAKSAPGQIMQWRISKRLASPDTIVPPSALSAEMREALGAGTVVRTESDGLMNLARVAGNPGGPQIENVFGGAGWGLALASATLSSDRPRTVTLRFAYSEGINVLLNGTSVFVGTHPYTSPDLGRILGDVNAVDLPLRRGQNELILVVTDRAFGWGFRARLQDGEGVKISAANR